MGMPITLDEWREQVLAVHARAERAEKRARAWKWAAKHERSNAQVWQRASDSSWNSCWQAMKERDALTAALHAIYYGDVSGGFQEWAKAVAGRALGIATDGEQKGPDVESVRSER